MPKNITLMGASYSDVPGVTLPQTGGGTAYFADVSPTTAVETDVASGKIFYKADGTQATGSASGAAAISVVDELDSHGGTIRHISGVSLQGDTVTAEHLEYGYTAHDAGGNAITGTLSPGGGGTPRTSSDLTVSGATVTAPAGVYAADASKTIASGTARVPSSITGTSANMSAGTNQLTFSKTIALTPDVTAGYIASGTERNATVSLTASVTTKASTTYHPSTSDQSVAAITFCTGAQTFKGVTVSGLEAGNIKSGVTVKIGDSTDDDCVTSVTGTYTGGGGSLSVDTKTVTASQYPVSISFSSMKGEPKYFFLRSTSQISSSGSTTYYYIIDMRYDGGTNHYCNGNVFRIGSTRRVEVITTASSGGTVTGYTWSYSGTTLTITSSAATRSASPGAFNNTYELVYLY